MENTIDEPVQLPNTVELNNEALGYLDSIRKWTKFFSILAFIGLGIMVLLALTMGTVMGAISNAGMNQGLPFQPFLFSILYIIFAGFYVYPAISLYKFSNTLGQMLQTRDSNKASEAFKYFKGHLKYVGIFTIVILSLYLLIFLFSFMTVLFL